MGTTRFIHIAAFCALAGFALPLWSQQALPSSLLSPDRAPEGTINEQTPEPGRDLVSADILRHPIPSKARRMLQAALDHMKRRDHTAAIGALRETLEKYPSSAPYVHSLLGVEYLKTDQFAAAANSFEQAANLLPHDAVNRYNLGLALVSEGDYERGEKEVRRALELDPGNENSQMLLNVLIERKRSVN